MWEDPGSFHFGYMGHLHLHGLDHLGCFLQFAPCEGLLSQDVVHHLHDALVRQRGHGAVVHGLDGLHSLHGLHRLLRDQHRLDLLRGRLLLGGPQLGGQVGGQDADGVLHLRALVVELQGVFLQHDLAGEVVAVVLGHVFAEGARVDVGILAHGAHVRTLPRVRADVALQGAGVGPGHAAGQTFERLHS